MSDSPKAHYKPDLFMSTAIPVYLPATDWVVFLRWLLREDVNTNTVGHICSDINDQVEHAVYTPESLKAIEAAYAEHMAHQNQPPEVLRHILRAQGIELPDGPPRPEDFG